MLSAFQPLPYRPERIAVAGVSGSGKSTLARRVADLLDLPYTEMDALHHGAGWTRRATFETDVAGLLAAGRWVTEWQYADARPLLAEQADLMVWVDLPFRVTLSRVVRRTVRRRLRREELWNGNREGPLLGSSPTPSTSSGGRSGRGVCTTSGSRRSPRPGPTCPSSGCAPGARSTAGSETSSRR